MMVVNNTIPPTCIVALMIPLPMASKMVSSPYWKELENNKK
jgi:hypothetical protein